MRSPPPGCVRREEAPSRSVPRTIIVDGVHPMWRVFGMFFVVVACVVASLFASFFCAFVFDFCSAKIAGFIKFICRLFEFVKGA